MFWALAEGRIDAGDFEFEHVLRDIQTLNEWALEGRLEVTAISLHAYPFVQDKYVLLPHGASMGFGYGPIVVAREEVDLSEVEVAVPGRMTTAFLTLELFRGGPFRYRVVPFDRILDEVVSGEADAGLLIHEGQLTYQQSGLVKIVDLGEWWLKETGLPLPLGVNVARRDLGAEVLRDLARVLGDSIDAGLANREEALRYSLQFGRGLRIELADRFVGMYVNDLTRDYGEDGRRAVTELLRRGEAAGAFSAPVQVDFVRR
jgi:1,4-dihydroxy-6-naphthoate synthase